MEQAKQILDASLLWRILTALCGWVGHQWQNSRLIHWFLHPAPWGKALSESSLFYRLWIRLRSGLRRLYRLLHLERLFQGSVFLRPWIWCGLPVVLAPLLSVSHPSLTVLAMVLIGGASLLLSLLHDPQRELPWSPVNRYIILYAGVYFAGVLFSVDVESSLEPGLLTICFILFAVMLNGAITQRRHLDTLVSLMVLVGAAVSIYGILQYIFRFGYQSSAWVDKDMFASIKFRVPSTLENPNMLGQYLILTISLGGAKLLSARDGKRRILWLCCCAVMCVCSLLTFSRGAWLGLLFAGVIFAVLLQPRLILLAPFCLLLLALVMPETILTRFASIGNLKDNSTTYRVYIWLGTLDMLQDYWMCGIGPGTTAFNLVYPAYSYSTIVAPHSHSLFLQILCDGGICALAVFLLLLFVYFRMLCVALCQETNWTSRTLQAAATAGLCGFLVQATTDYSFYNYRVMFLFWAFLALGSLAARRSAMTEGRHPH